MRRWSTSLSVAGCTIVVAAVRAADHAHLTVERLPAGQSQRLDLQVPDERDDADTQQVTVQVPSPFARIACVREPGWSCAVARQGGQSLVTFSLEASPPGRDELFSLRGQTPGEPGVFTLPTAQRYDDGDVARWVGPADSPEPAPVLQITPADAGRSPRAQVTSTAPAAASSLLRVRFRRANPQRSWRPEAAPDRAGRAGRAAGGGRGRRGAGRRGRSGGAPAPAWLRRQSCRTPTSRPPPARPRLGTSGPSSWFAGRCRATSGATAWR